MAPCLMRNTELFDLKAGRLLEVFPEHFLIMGYPAQCSAVPTYLARFFPFPELIAENRLTDNSLRILTGNGMHLSAIGAALTFVWSTIAVHT